MPTDKNERKNVLLFCILILFAIFSFQSANRFFTTDTNIKPHSNPDTEETIASITEPALPANTSSAIVLKHNQDLLLVNAKNPLPQGFSVTLTPIENGHTVDENICTDLQNMLDDARALGLEPIICSSYRTEEQQEELFEKKVRSYLRQGYSQTQAEEQAKKWVAFPGTSEHQTGLAVDIVAKSYQMLEETQENTPEQKWLMENAWQYGFILRYPKNKVALTGIEYEPWHYRYVGKDAAKEMVEYGLCLEEYVQA